MGPIVLALLNPPCALPVGFEMPHETAIAWFARSRDVTVDQLTEDEVSKSEVPKVVVHILREARKKAFQLAPLHWRATRNLPR